VSHQIARRADRWRDAILFSIGRGIGTVVESGTCRQIANSVLCLKPERGASRRHPMFKAPIDRLNRGQSMLACP
jgi:hypothetical protein